MKAANAQVQHNVPVTLSNHLNSLLKNAFRDSEISKSYTSVSTKTTCIIDGVLAPPFKSALIEAMSIILAH